MTQEDTSTLYRDALTERLALALYRMPDEEQIQYITGTATRRHPVGVPAFAFAPFDRSGQPYFINPAITSPMRGGQVLTDDKVESTTKKAFTEHVKYILARIDADAYEKIVAARVWVAKRPLDFDPIAFFHRLCAEYPTAFVSLTYVPNVGLWIGASPEILAAQSATALTTYALAGTQAIDDHSDWPDKEKREQRIVSDFIRRKLSKIAGEDIKAKGPVTIEAGSVKHLLTVFTLRSKDKNLWSKVVKTLHPTPAVAGMLQDEAVRFIKRYEPLDRKFYAGYLGPINIKGKTDLYVNLRCMEVTDSQLIFYAGCGITAGSDPAQEWLESERKIDVLRALCL